MKEVPLEDGPKPKKTSISKKQPAKTKHAEKNNNRNVKKDTKQSQSVTKAQSEKKVVTADNMAPPPFIAKMEAMAKAHAKKTAIKQTQASE